MSALLHGLALLAVGLASEIVAAQGVKVGFASGLQLTWANAVGGEPDYEVVLSVTAVDSAEGRVKLSWNRGVERTWQTVERTVSSRERRLARAITFYGSNTDPRQFRGANQTLASSAILGELKRTGRAGIVLLMPEVSNVPFRGTLERIGTGTEPFPVLLDGRRVTLKAIRARGTMVGERTTQLEVLVLDEAESPWILDVKSSGDARTTQGRRQLVRVATREREREVPAALERSCSVSIHDIYFATGSDALDSTSTPALTTIANALRAHRDWQVTIVGHTDSIGTAAANLDLSKRRAERVRSTLDGAFGVPAARLRAEGKGETEPIDDNGGLLGRARNRRVDLTRVCK